MKALHRPEFWGWTVFNPERNLDFHSVLWVRPEGNCAFDPLPLSEHDRAHLLSLGSLSHIFVSNADHLRDAQALAEQTGAQLWGPAAENNSAYPHTLQDGDQPLPGLQVFALQGSKTPGELAFVIEGHTLITGDLIRAHRAGQLCLLPDAKLSDKAAAQASVRQLVASRPEIETVLVGDGWPIFGQGQQALQQMITAF